MKKCMSIAALSLALGAGGVVAQEGATVADVNIGHLAPFDDTIPGTAVSIDINGVEEFNPVLFKQFTGYQTFTDVSSPFDVDVDVFAPPATPPAAISGTLTLEDSAEYTVAAIGGANGWPLEFLVLTDSIPVRGDTQALLRVAHAAPFSAQADGLAATEADIRTDGGTALPGLTNVPYKVDSGFFPIDAGEYDLKVTTPGGGTTLIDLAPVTLDAGDEVTVFAVGDGTNQPVGAVAFFEDGTVVELPLEDPLPETRAVPTLGWLGIALMALLLGGIGVRRMI
jgi:hypothetical protein